MKRQVKVCPRACLVLVVVARYQPEVAGVRRGDVTDHVTSTC